MPQAALIGSVLLGLFCFLLISAGAANLVVIIKGAVKVRKQKACGSDDCSAFLLEPGMAPEVAMIAVPPDASEESQSYVRRLLKLHSDSYEVILVLDGPSDSDIDTWRKAFHLKPVPVSPGNTSEVRKVRTIYKSLEPIRLTVVDSEGVGESACLNTGVLVTKAPIVGYVDSRAQFADDALLRLIRPMVNDPERTIAVCGVGPAEPAPGLAACLHRLKSIRTWLGRCAGLSAWNMLLPASGSFMLMKRDAVIGSGGFRYGLVDLVLRLHAVARAKGASYSIRFVSSSVSRPGTPESTERARALDRWDRSEMRKALRRNFGLFFCLGSLGCVALPGLLWAYLRPAVKIAVPTLSVLAFVLGSIEWLPLFLLLAGTFGFEILVTMAAVILHEYAFQPETDPGELTTLFLGAVQEQLAPRWFLLRR